MELCDNIEYKKNFDIIFLDKKVRLVNVRSKILKIRNLPADGTRIDQIKAKPYGFIILFLLLGIAMTFTRFYIFGFIIAAVFLFYLVGVKDMVLVEFFDCYAVFYLNNGLDECFLLFWDDIEHWEIVSSRRDLDVLNITLKNNQTISLKCLGKKKIEKYFCQYVPCHQHIDKMKQHI